MNIENVLCIIKESPSSLFYGTGVTKDCGGPSWEELLSDLKKKFPNCDDNDPFKYMDGIISFDDSNRKEIEDILRTRLASISPQGDQKYLFSMPWRAALTTNYDHLPDAVNITLDESRQIIPISDPAEQIDHRRVDRLYCFKLLGDVKFSFPQGGWMVLSESDLFSAGDRRTAFFNQFRNLATTGHIVYLGCSFKDDIIFRILNQMKKTLGRFPWKGFAITPSEPDMKIKKKLDAIGIEWVKGDLGEFIAAAKKLFGDVPTSSPIQIGCLTIHQRTIDIDRSVLSNIHNKFSILHNELLQSETEKPIDFLRGRCESFFPYVFNWDFPRKTKREWLNRETKMQMPTTLLDLKMRVKDEELIHNCIVALVGGAGSGKTVIAGRLSFEWYQTGNPVIFINPDNRGIDQDALDGLMNEIREKYLAKVDKVKKEDSHPLRWLVVADDCGNMLSDLRLLRNHLVSSGKPTDIVLISRETDMPIEKLKTTDVDAIYRVDDTIMPQERDLFLRHFKRFGILDEDIAQKNLMDKEINSSFFALIFSCIRHSSENIKRLLQEEYNRLDDESKRIYSFVSLIQAYRLQPLASLLIKSWSIDYDWLQNQTARGSLGGVVRYADFGNVLLTPNRLIAETICEIAFPNSAERKRGLSRLISAVTYGDYAEMQFLDTLLNSRIEQDMGPRVSIDHKIDLFREGIKKVRSRPLLIHLGRVETNAQRFGDAKKTLLEAHDACVTGFDEMDEHVLDAEGRLEFALAELDMRPGDKNDSAWDHLEKAEDFFLSAKINPRLTPHPYEGIARVYLAKGKLVKEQEMQWVYILAAMRECNYFENYLGENSEISLVKMEIENALKLIGFNETHVSRITDSIGKANGYAYLAELAVSSGSPRDAFAFVEKGLKNDATNIWLMRLRVKLLRLISPDSHDAIMTTLDDYAAMSNESFDIELSFELAKETYTSGRVQEAKVLFRQLSFKAIHHTRRLIPRDPQDRWMEKGRPFRLTGTLAKVPTEDRYGIICTTFPSNFRDNLVVRKRDIQFRDPPPHNGERVTYEVIFNMLGPEASRVRR